MATDAAPGRYQDQPGSGAVDRLGRQAGGPAGTVPVRSNPAETLGRAAYYEVARAAAERHPVPDSIRLPPERVRHILDGDRWGGGHRHGTGRPGKAEFPASWDDEQTIGHIMDLPDAPLAGLNVEG